MAAERKTISRAIFTKTHAGVLRVRDTRVSLDAILDAFNEGAAAEEIVWRFPTLNLTQVYTVIAYYLQNKDEVDGYIANGERQDLKLQKELQQRFPTAEICQKLLLRYKNKK